MAVSKILAVKGFAALSTTSVVGTGAISYFQTKDYNKQIQEAIAKKFAGKTNEAVLKNAGFKDASINEDIFKKSLQLRLTNEKVTDELVKKFERFCKEGISHTFKGITEVYKTLAAICSRTITLEGKVERDNLNLLDASNISSKLSLITEKHRNREFIKSLDKEDSESLLKACKKFGSKDVFSYEVSKEILADYMTFCVKEKPSVIRFWTGSDNPKEIVDYWFRVQEQERQSREGKGKGSVGTGGQQKTQIASVPSR